MARITTISESEQMRPMVMMMETYSVSGKR